MNAPQEETAGRKLVDNDGLEHWLMRDECYCACPQWRQCDDQHRCQHLPLQAAATEEAGGAADRSCGRHLPQRIRGADPLFRQAGIDLDDG
jgi:hypothetical protein